MSETPVMPELEGENSSDERVENPDNATRKVRYLIIFGLLLVISISGFVFYLNVSQGERDSLADTDTLDPAEAARGSVSLVTAVSPSATPDVQSIDELGSIAFEVGDGYPPEIESRLDQLIELAEQLDGRLSGIESNQEAIVASLLSHAKTMDSIVSRNDGFDEIARSHFRVSNQVRESVRNLSEQVSQIDGSISSEFSRFPVFVWGVSSWGNRRFLTVSHLDSPRNTTEISEGDEFHGWVLESAGTNKVVFRSGEKLHEVDL